MPVGRFLLCLHSHMPYVLSHGKSPHGTDWLTEAAAECYLPLLHTLDRLRNEGIKPRWTVNIVPILAEQLTDPAFADEFENYCQEKIDFALADQRDFAAKGELWMEGVAAFWQRFYTRSLVQFKHQWGRNIVEAFRYFQDHGSIEIITSGATHGYQPLLGTDESCQAQLDLGVQVYEKHFGRKPRGVWLPECAYRPRYDWKSPVGAGQVPWPRMGTEEVVKNAGIEYFFVDSHMIRGGVPLGTYAANFPQLAEMFARSSKYFTPPAEFRSEYEHYILPNGITVFARDPETTVKVWSGDAGYPGDEHYLEFHKQLYPGRLRYWRISQQKSDLGAKQPYDPYAAFERIAAHAEDLVQTLKGTLAHYKGLSDRTGTLVAMYDTELFGHWWWEGPEFLYEVARAIHRDGSLAMVSGGDVLDEEPARHMITMPEGSWGEGGYHYIWINDNNVWTWEKLYVVERKLRQMARDYGDGPARRIVLQAAREMLLAESSDWQFLISTFSARDYAEIRFADHIERFDRLAALAEKVHGGGKPTKADQEFLEECEAKDAPFQELDLRLWKTIPEPAHV
ncbi:MAG: glycoside hydrolase family 57 protein [Fimbriimonadaceae bacterium]